MDKSFSHQMVEAFAEFSPKLLAMPLDTVDSQPPGDYSFIHSDLGECIIEVKELEETEDFAKQFEIEKEIREYFEGIFKDKGFFCNFSYDFLPDNKLLKEIKTFFTRIESFVKIPGKDIPLKIFISHDLVRRKSELVTIERLSNKDEVIERIYSPETVSGKYEYHYAFKDAFHYLHDRCRVTIGEQTAILDERKVWDGNKPLLEFSYDHCLIKGCIRCNFNLTGINEARRIRDRIRVANSQLKNYRAKKIPLGTIICPSNILTGSFDFFECAFLGDPGIAMNVNTEESAILSESVRPIYIGDQALLSKNTTTGFVALLEGTLREQTLKLVHNAFSDYGVSYEYLLGDNVDQFVFGRKEVNGDIKPKLYSIHSDEELKSFRENHRRIEALLNRNDRTK